MIKIVTLCKDVYVDYKHRGIEYTAKPFVIKSVTKKLMDMMPIIKNRAYVSEGLIERKDFWTNKDYINKTLWYINRHYVLKGEITPENIIPDNTLNWKTLRSSFLQAYNQICCSDHRWDSISFEPHGWCKIRLDDDATPPQIRHGLETKRALGIVNRCEANINKSKHQLIDVGVRPRFMDETVKLVNSVNKKLLK